MNVAYNCKFCGRLESVEIEDNAATIFCIEKWQRMLCCNWCGDYMVAKRKIHDSVKRGCMMLSQFRMSVPIEKLAESETKIKAKLTLLLSKYSEIVCRHYQQPQNFDHSFVDEFMNQPDKWFTILSVYESGVRRARQVVRQKLAVQQESDIIMI